VLCVVVPAVAFDAFRLPWGELRQLCSVKFQTHLQVCGAGRPLLCFACTADGAALLCLTDPMVLESCTVGTLMTHGLAVATFPGPEGLLHAVV
jgi:hypothetical protein